MTSLANQCPSITPDEFAVTLFDFIIIGGGTAGLAVAVRLSEDPRLNVGVLEAGSPAFGDGAVDLPGLAGSTLGTGLDWNFQTTPQPGLGGRSLLWARGKVLGGSSALNYMTWNRASRQDYDDWAELGNQGWGWDDLLPFFKKSESFHEPSSQAQSEAQVTHHSGVLGSDGPIQVSYPGEYTASHGLWHRTMNAVGVKSNDAHLAGSNIGCWTSVVSVDPQSIARSYAATAYYLPNVARQNLVVLTGAEVREILLVGGENRNDWEARGVRFVHGGAELSAFASCEVIVSAGSVQSPQILELSGIGDESVLSAAGIPVKVANSNVGENLQDHLTTTLVFEVDPSLPNPDDLKTPEGLAAARGDFESGRTGLLTVLPVSLSYVPITHIIPQKTVDAMLKSSLPTKAPTNHPFIKRDDILRRRFSVRSKALGHVEYIFDLANWSPSLVPNQSDGKKYGSMLQILQYPFSRGSVHIQSPSSVDTKTFNLAIDPQYCAGRHGQLDLEIAMHCHRFAEKICSTEPLASIIRGQVCPVPSEIANNDDLRRWVQQNIVTDWHPVGTCAMGGHDGARAGVVDERLRVYGVRKLRVVDASVMPLQISAHLQATVYAIAEKAASMILEDLAGRD